MIDFDLQFKTMKEFSRYKRFCENKNIDYKDDGSLSDYYIHKDLCESEKEYLNSKTNDLLEY